jgi:uncharacterized protein YndB with AHSA1/START domain
MSEEKRSLEVSIELNASAETVWNALTNGEELSRWFPPAARVDPGVGGKIWLSWGEDFQGEAVIEAWEPNRYLRTSWGLIVEYFIEAKGDATVLRVVQSGFGAEASWDDMYESTKDGWKYFLFNLRYYLEHHAGKPRTMVSVRHPMTIPREEAWPLLLGKNGLAVEPADPGVGQNVRLKMNGKILSGELFQMRKARNFGCTMKSLNDGLLFIELESGQEKWNCGVWLSLYGPAPEAPALQRALQTMMSQLFPVPATV